MDNTVLATLISTIGAVMIAGFGYLGAVMAKQGKHITETKKLSEEAKTQVTNSHTNNFRDEVTEGFTEMRTSLREVQEEQKKQGGSIKAVHGKVNHLNTFVAELRASDKAQWHKLDRVPDEVLVADK